MMGTRVEPEMKERIKSAAAKERRKVADWIRCRLEDALQAAEPVIEKEIHHG